MYIKSLGIYSVLGADLQTVQNALISNTPARVIDDPEKQALGFRSVRTMPFPTPPTPLPRTIRRSGDEQTAYAYHAVKQALEGMTEEEIRKCALVVACDSTANAYHPDNDTRSCQQVFRQLNTSVAMNIARAFHIEGAVTTVSAACASGLVAFDTAIKMNLGSDYDHIIVLGVQETGPHAVQTLDRLGVLSQTETKPFAKDHDGFIPTGGAACVVLESPSHYLLREGKTALGYIHRIWRNNGHCTTMIAPDKEAERALLIKAMKAYPPVTYHREPTDNDPQSTTETPILIAHATGTPDGDETEAQAILDAEDSVGWNFARVRHYKGLCGHEMWMSGVTQVLYSCLKYQDLNQPIIANAFGFGGNNAVCYFEVY